MLFGCDHPWHRLGVNRAKPTIEAVDADYEHVTFHLFCRECGKNLNIKCATFVGGVDEFLNREQR